MKQFYIQNTPKNFDILYEVLETNKEKFPKEYFMGEEYHDGYIFARGHILFDVCEEQYMDYDEDVIIDCPYAFIGHLAASGMLKHLK